MTPKTCQFCDRPAVTESVTGSATDPPMCAKHLDLLITVEYIIGRNREPTQELVLALLASARQRGGALAITDEEVPELLPAVLAALGYGAPAGQLPEGLKKEARDA